MAASVFMKNYYLFIAFAMVENLSKRRWSRPLLPHDSSGSSLGALR
jgi:hypothetical protein